MSQPDLTTMTAVGVMHWLNDTASTLLDISEQIAVASDKQPLVPPALQPEVNGLVAACRDVWRAKARLERAGALARKAEAAAHRKKDTP